MAFDPNGPVGKAMQAMAGSAWFQKVGPIMVPPSDRVIHKLSGGRLMFSRLLLPSAIVTTTGRKSGEKRPTPLASIPLDGVLHVVGSNYGKQSHPVWTLNLLADPSCDVSFEGESYRANAVLLEGDDRAAAWADLLDVWPLYDEYEAKAGRTLRVFRLDRVS